MRMSKTCVIQWKSKENGRVGRGTKIFDEEDAAQRVEELNLEYSQIHHEMVCQNPNEEDSIVNLLPAPALSAA